MATERIRVVKTILGIDPGSRITGFGVIKSNGLKHSYVTSGCIRVSPTKDQAIKLQQIYDGLREVIFRFQPDEAVVEQIFFHKNPNSALKLGQARGVALLAPALHQISVAEYSARQVKQSVVGYGAASKEQVQMMIQTILKLSGTPQADAADALAVAICHAQTQGLLSEAYISKPKLVQAETNLFGI